MDEAPSAGCCIWISLQKVPWYIDSMLDTFHTAAPRFTDPIEERRERKKARSHARSLCPPSTPSTPPRAGTRRKHPPLLQFLCACRWRPCPRKQRKQHTKLAATADATQGLTQQRSRARAQRHTHTLAPRLRASRNREASGVRPMVCSSDPALPCCHIDSHTHAPRPAACSPWCSRATGHTGLTSVFACQRRWRPRRARDRTPHHPHHDHPFCTPPRRLSHPPPHFARGAAPPARRRGRRLTWRRCTRRRSRRGG